MAIEHEQVRKGADSLDDIWLTKMRALKQAYKGDVVDGVRQENGWIHGSTREWIGFTRGDYGLNPHQIFRLLQGVMQQFYIMWFAACNRAEGLSFDEDERYNAAAVQAAKDWILARRQGIGIPAADIDRIRDRFRTLFGRQEDA